MSTNNSTNFDAVSKCIINPHSLYRILEAIDATYNEFLTQKVMADLNCNESVENDSKVVVKALCHYMDKLNALTDEVESLKAEIEIFRDENYKAIQQSV